MIFCQISYLISKELLNKEYEFSILTLEKFKKKIKNGNTKVIHQHKRLCTLVSEKKIKQSLDILADMIRFSSGDLHDEYDDMEMTYRNMLTYTIEGIKDPERKRYILN